MNVFIPTVIMGHVTIKTVTIGVLTPGSILVSGGQ